jgi:hypothetical protein
MIKNTETISTVDLGEGVENFLGTPTSENLAAAITDESGTGALAFATSPALITPDLGTPSALVLTNATGRTSSSQTADKLQTPSELLDIDELEDGQFLWRDGTTVSTPGFGPDDVCQIDDARLGALQNNTGLVDSLAAEPPTIGQVPVATSATTFEWQDPGGGAEQNLGLIPTALKTSNYTAAFGEMVLVDLGAGSPLTITLPTAVKGFVSLVDNRKRVGIKVLNSDLPSTLTIASASNSFENGQASDAFSGLNYGAYIEYEYDPNGQDGNGEWRKTSLIRPLRQMDGSSGGPTQVGTLYRIVDNPFSDITAFLPIAQRGERIAFKLGRNFNAHKVTVDAGTGGAIDPTGAGGPQTVILSRSFEYLELECTGGAGGSEWIRVSVVPDLIRDPAIHIAGVGGGGFMCMRNTSHRFYTNTGAEQLIHMPDPSSGIRPGDRVELIAIGHGGDLFTIDDVGSIEFSRSIFSSTATFSSDGFYMLLEWCQNNSSASFGGVDCWVVIESTVGQPGSRHRLRPISSDITINPGDLALVDVSSSAVTVSLPSIHAQGDQVIVKQGASTANTLTVDGNGTNIEGVSTATLTGAYDLLKLESTGFEWVRLNAATSGGGGGGGRLISLLNSNTTTAGTDDIILVASVPLAAGTTYQFTLQLFQRGVFADEFGAMTSGVAVDLSAGDVTSIFYKMSLGGSADTVSAGTYLALSNTGPFSPHFGIITVQGTIVVGATGGDLQALLKQTGVALNTTTALIGSSLEAIAVT